MASKQGAFWGMEGDIDRWSKFARKGNLKGLSFPNFENIENRFSDRFESKTGREGCKKSKNALELSDFNPKFLITSLNPVSGKTTYELSPWG